MLVSGNMQAIACTAIPYLECPVGPMDKAPASGAGDSGFESPAGLHYVVRSDAPILIFSFCFVHIYFVSRKHVVLPCSTGSVFFMFHHLRLHYASDWCQPQVLDLLLQVSWLIDAHAEMWVHTILLGCQATCWRRVRVVLQINWPGPDPDKTTLSPIQKITYMLIWLYKKR